MGWDRHNLLWDGMGQKNMSHGQAWYTLQVRHKQDWGQGFILLLFQAVVLPESDAGSDVIKPALSVVIQK